MEPLIDSSSENSDDNLCSICFEKLDEEKGEIKIMECCKQNFHKDCINEWLSNYSPSYNCPHCRKSLLTNHEPDDEKILAAAFLKTFGFCVSIYFICGFLMLLYFVFKNLDN